MFFAQKNHQINFVASIYFFAIHMNCQMHLTSFVLEVNYKK